MLRYEKRIWNVFILYSDDGCADFEDSLKLFLIEDRAFMLF
jgi:hypothetical protein